MCLGAEIFNMTLKFDILRGFLLLHFPKVEVKVSRVLMNGILGHGTEKGSNYCQDLTTTHVSTQKYYESLVKYLCLGLEMFKAQRLIFSHLTSTIFKDHKRRSIGFQEVLF